MQKYTMTVHEGLAELKILAARIEKELSQSVYVNTTKHSNTKIDGMTIADYSKAMASAMQKVEDLIARRNAIKRAITKSNATTEVTINKENGDVVKMTVAELIEYRNVGIEFVNRLANTLSQQYKVCTNTIKKTNDSLTEMADRYVTGLFGSKEGVQNDVIEAARKSYIEANTVDLLDPNKVQEKITALREEYDFFNTKVDAALSTSNAVTVIEFEC